MLIGKPEKLIDCEKEEFREPVPCNFKDAAKRWLGAEDNCSVISCDRKNDNKLEKGLYGKIKNITFETQNTGDVSWLPKDRQRAKRSKKHNVENTKKANYKYVFVFSYVEFAL